jgi:hypothetical protein
MFTVRCSANTLNFPVSLALISFFTCLHFLFRPDRSSSARQATIALESHCYTFFCVCAGLVIGVVMPLIFFRLTRARTSIVVHLVLIAALTSAQGFCLSTPLLYFFVRTLHKNVYCQKCEDGVLLPCISNSVDHGAVRGPQLGYHVSEHAGCLQSRHPQSRSY